MKELLHAVHEAVRYRDDQSLTAAQIVAVLAEVMSNYSTDAFNEQFKAK